MAKIPVCVLFELARFVFVLCTHKSIKINVYIHMYKSVQEKKQKRALTLASAFFLLCARCENGSNV